MSRRTRILAPAVCLLLLLGILPGCNKLPEPEPGEITPPVIFVDGYYCSLDRANATYSALLATTTDFSAMPVEFRTDAGRILLGERELAKKGELLDLRSPLTIRVVMGRTYEEFTLQVRNTGLPVVRITTPRAVTSKTNWLAGATLRIELPDGTVDYEGPMSIRGRGNSTWNYPKKPYALKLDEKARILSMPSQKRWVLLANWKDRTLLRNDAAFWLSSHTGLPYTVRGQFVELVLNGSHMGNYYLCEQIRIAKKRVPVEDGGLLLELDTYFDEPNRFLSQDFQLPWMVKEPDEDELTPEQFEDFKQWIRDLETLLKDEERVKAHEYTQYLDVDTAIDFMIVQELTCNQDFYNNWPTNMPPGPHSVYLYKQPGGKLYTGPVWDFDYHTFVPNRTKQWAGANRTMYYPALLKDPDFRARMVERWDAQKGQLKGLTEYIDEMVQQLSDSEGVNHTLWPIPTTQNENGDEQISFPEAVGRMKESFLAKWSWMDSHIRQLK